MTPARLILEDGTSYAGESFGSPHDAIGEVVFNTTLTGYQEVATDPSYRFQIVIMTYPHIGNYGIDAAVDQSDGPQVAGMVVREVSEHPSNATSQMSIDEYFKRTKVAAITGIDTRSLTKKIRSEGAMRGMITTNASRSADDVVAEIKRAPSMTGLDLVCKVTALRPYILNTVDTPKRRIAVYDYGVKRGILQQLTQRGCEVTVYPATHHPDEILNLEFDGVVLSNGPGDPEPVVYAQDNIKKLIGRVPILGICLGHQLLGLSLGGRTFKLKFGHRGGNHPVKDLVTGRVEITSQNHGFSVDPDSLKDSEVDFTHVNLNDGTLEGFRHKTHPILAVQYHPEAAPGPHDSFYLFDEFMRMIEERKS